MATGSPDDSGYTTIDESKSNYNEAKAHNRKHSNGVQKQNKIINPVKQLERMATSGSLTKDSNQRKYFAVSCPPHRRP